MKKNKLIDRNFIENIIDKGRYGIIALIAYLTYKLADKAIDNNYNFSASVKNLKIEFTK